MTHRIVTPAQATHQNTHHQRTNIYTPAAWPAASVSKFAAMLEEATRDSRRA